MTRLTSVKLEEKQLQLRWEKKHLRQNTLKGLVKKR